MQASLLCPLHLKNSGAGQIWEKANSTAHHTILSKLGVQRIIHPEEEMGTRVAQALNYPMVNDYLSIGHGLYVVEITLPAAKKPQQVQHLIQGFERSIHCLLIKRGSALISAPSLVTDVQEDDLLLLCGPREALVRIAPRLV